MMEITEEMAQLIQDSILAQQIADSKEYDIIPTIFNRADDFHAYQPLKELAA